MKGPLRNNSSVMKVPKAIKGQWSALQVGFGMTMSNWVKITLAASYYRYTVHWNEVHLHFFSPSPLLLSKGVQQHFCLYKAPVTVVRGENVKWMEGDTHACFFC